MAFDEAEYEVGLTRLPDFLAEAINQCKKQTGMNDAMLALFERQREFRNSTAAILAGVALNPAARSYVNDELDAHWQDQTEQMDDLMGTEDNPVVFDEVVIGAGYHAAIYCAIRVSKGFPAPLVLERSDRVGGSFAPSNGPSFYLNSRNRPGELGLPGTRDALNVIPGALIQPSDLGGDEFQTNDAMAWPIRVTLAANATIALNKKVNQVRIDDSTEARIRLEDGIEIRALRVIIASGPGEPRLPTGPQPDGQRVLSFEQLMARMDKPFPLAGMKRVAVIGAGDSGRCAIEAMTGQGPSGQWSIASLDWPEEIDWYGLPEQALTRNGWESCNRSRYKQIARLFPAGRAGERPRVRPLATRVSAIAPNFDGVVVAERPYDHAIVTTGFLTTPLRRFSLPTLDAYNDGGGRAIAASDVTGNPRVFVVGPAAKDFLPVLTEEQQVAPFQLAENAIAMFRLAPRTAALAASLEAPVREGALEDDPFDEDEPF